MAGDIAKDSTWNGAGGFRALRDSGDCCARPGPRETHIADRNASHLSEQARRRVREASRKFMIHYAHLTPIVYTSVRPNGVLLTIRYLCSPQNRRGSEERLWEDILKAFAEHEDLQFAYPTWRIYTPEARGEGWDGAGGAPGGEV